MISKKIKSSFKRIVFKFLYEAKVFNNNFLAKIFYLFLNNSLKINFSLKNIIELNDPKYNLYISRRNRLGLYSMGIDYRLKELANQYLIHEIKFSEKDIIVDCGANIGEFSFYINNKYNSKIIAFEPDKIEFNVLLKNLNGQKLYNSALSNKNGVVEFFLDNKTADSSIFFSNEKECVEVQSFTLDSVIQDNNLDNVKLLKLEAEGAEPEVLNGALNSLKFIEYITADCGAERGLNNETTIREVTNILYDNNFELINTSSFRNILLFKNKNLINKNKIK